VPDEAIIRLFRQAPFGFVGTVEHLGAATMTSVPIDDRTAVVRVDQLLRSPDGFLALEGQRITVRLGVDRDPPAVGETAVFFAEGLAFGDSVAVAEIGRVAVEALEAEFAQSAEAGPANPLADLERQAEVDHLREHASQAAAIVLGRVVKLEKVGPTSYSEHDPDWWQATIDVHHVERGTVEAGLVAVLYANSLDVRWRAAPKPKASQTGLWILHATEGDLARIAPFQILAPEDYQPPQGLDVLRERTS
jgi:hypothetical protein